MNKLRFLHFDDLLVLRDLADGTSITSIAKRLSISQPAVTQRVKKIEMIFGKGITEKVGRGLKLTSEGREIAARACLALSALGDESKTPEQMSVSIGARSDVAISWLYPALMKTCEAFPHIRAHIYQGSGDEILQRLGNGKLDAVVTSAPITARDFSAIDLKVEKYLFAAPAKVAKQIEALEDLEDHVLIEHDRSFPFQRYLSQDVRAKLRFKDVMFLGGTRGMARAIADSVGVGIIPEFAVEPYLKSKVIKAILPSVKLESDLFRLIYRRADSVPMFYETLAKTLHKNPYNSGGYIFD